MFFCLACWQVLCHPASPQPAYIARGSGPSALSGSIKQEELLPRGLHTVVWIPVDVFSGAPKPHPPAPDTCGACAHREQFCASRNGAQETPPPHSGTEQWDSAGGTFGEMSWKYVPWWNMAQVLKTTPMLVKANLKGGRSKDPEQTDRRSWQTGPA